MPGGSGSGSVMRVQPGHGFFGSWAGQMQGAGRSWGGSRYLSGLVLSLVSPRVSRVMAFR